MIRSLVQRLVFQVSNISQQQVKYSFEAASVKKIHPMRNLSGGTDRLLVTPNLLVMADHGSPTLVKNSANLDDSFSTKLLAVLDLFFHH
jgi:hypothetical protein